VLRARLPGRPTRDCLFSDVATDGVTALKVPRAPARRPPGAAAQGSLSDPCHLDQPNKSTQHKASHSGISLCNWLLQVWNRNLHGGVIGAFNLQGASWDRTVRNFRVPEEPPGAVTARLKPADVEGLHSDTGRFVTWLHESRAMKVLGPSEEVPVELDPQGSEVRRPPIRAPAHPAPREPVRGRED
jgi:hypothetical protein